MVTATGWGVVPRHMMIFLLTFILVPGNPGFIKAEGQFHLF